MMGSVTGHDELYIDPSAAIPPQFRRAASALLGRAVLVARDTRYRFTELEFYYRGGDHGDPFVHGHPLQRTRRRWYFHRRGESYVGGSFKGLDITLGDGAAHGGMLIRGLQSIDGDGDGAVIDGPCRCVEALLAAAGYDHVRDLDHALGEREIWHSSPLVIQLSAESETPERTIHYTARVGLTLKRYTAGSGKERYLMAPYRALTTPRTTRKGRVHLLMALHRAGRRVDEICALTGSPRRTVEGAIQRFQAGFADGDFAPYIDAALDTAALAALHGIWSRHFAPRDG